ncbi:histidine phosphatase family protein [Undibacterium flavidum]|uniref:Histidine phosphatase family protein n=1 Tax=Undibacterium flavidum TaxID=2762297 RepID=A0ABR6Y9U3_9BURK|nr:histidine phosphatase family protein [Undibacterium flavidum]MBC3873332.1 histidine phosphatase family protein [Undibacterium flavidum]
MRHIYLIRHGQASFDADDYDQLSPLGEEQSRLLGDWFKQSGQQLDRVVMGGNRRHYQTAQQCLQQFRNSPSDFPETDWIVDPGFDEFDHQEVLLRSHPEFADFRALKLSINHHPHPRRAFQNMFTAAVNRWIGGEHDDYSESWVQFQRRCRLALLRLIEGSDEQENYWIFTSGGIISALLQDVLGISDQRIFDLNASLVNSGFSKLRMGNSRISLNYLNSSAHLEIHQRADLVSYR